MWKLSHINLELPVISYRIACTKNQNFEEGENCDSTILVEHTLGYDMKIFGYNMILFVSISKVQYPTTILVIVLINFGVKNQVTKVSFKIVAGDLMSVFSHEFGNIIFWEYLDILE